MAVTTLTRATKGSALTHTEMDTNLTDLQDAVNIAKLETVTITTVSYTASTPRIILVDATSASVTVDLPAVASSINIVYIIKKIDSSAFTVTLDGNASETIDGATTLVLSSQWDTTRIVCDGTAWFVV